MQTKTLGEFEDSPTTDASDDNCDCDDLPAGFPCWECVRTGTRQIDA